MASPEQTLIENVLKTFLIISLTAGVTETVAGEFASVLAVIFLLKHCYDVGKKQTRIPRFFSGDSLLELTPDLVLIGGGKVADDAARKVFK